MDNLLELLAEWAYGEKFQSLESGDYYDLPDADKKHYRTSAREIIGVVKPRFDEIREIAGAKYKQSIGIDPTGKEQSLYNEGEKMMDALCDIYTLCNLEPESEPEPEPESEKGFYELANEAQAVLQKAIDDLTALKCGGIE